MSTVARKDRIHTEDYGTDNREPAQHDRDRVLHCNALRRLAGVTQVVNPYEGQIFHNRLTHTLKVAQIARRIAEKFLKEAEKKRDLKTLIDEVGGLDADVVETAALCHDLGHPPFAHTGEQVLNKLVRRHNTDGFEGNAQSFRIVTKLATRRLDDDDFAPQPGLNLTIASLRAMQKYPWHWDESGAPKKRIRKWGAYRTEAQELEKVKALGNGPEQYKRSLEAQIMDIADDITYATHDVEDFYRAGLIPLQNFWPRLRLNHIENLDENALSLIQDNLILVSSEADYFFDQVVNERQKKEVTEEHEYPCLDEHKFRELLTIIFGRLGVYLSAIDKPYLGHETQKAILRRAFDIVIDGYVQGLIINPAYGERPKEDLLTFQEVVDTDYPDVEMQTFTASMPEDCPPISFGRAEIRLFQELTHHFVHKNHSLQTQQHGEERILTELFNIYFAAYRAWENPDPHSHNVLPSDYESTCDREWRDHENVWREVAVYSDEDKAKPDCMTGRAKDAMCARLAADYITRMTDEEATRLYQRMTGHDLGYLHDNMP